MRKVTYVLSDGIVVNTMAAAKGSQGEYKVILTEVPAEPIKLSPIRKERMQTYGFVKPL